MRYWLMKADVEDCSILDLQKKSDQRIGWYGVRNYQARNFMINDMKMGDLAFFYHSNCPKPGIAGIVTIDSEPYPDPTQFDESNPYFDPKANKLRPRWVQVDVRFVKTVSYISLKDMRSRIELANFRLIKPGNRLSIFPVSEMEWHFINDLVK